MTSTNASHIMFDKSARNPKKRFRRKQRKQSTSNNEITQNEKLKNIKLKTQNKLIN